MNLRVIKRLGGFPCCHRQWRDTGHCAYLHGYDRFVELELEGPPDHRNWVFDFADFKEIRQALEKQYDHTVLMSPDDPALATFKALDTDMVIDLRITDPTMEGMTLWVRDLVERTLQQRQSTARLIRVTCWENEKNAAQWNRTVD